MIIQKASPENSTAITALTIRSKGFWNHGKELIGKWEANLTVSEEYITKQKVNKLIENDQLIGFYAFEKESAETAKLEFLFVDPPFIGKGHGKRLLADALDRMKQFGYRKVTLDADPNAEAFYNAEWIRGCGAITELH